MVPPLICDVKNISLAFHILMHERYGSGFLIVGSDMHALDALSLIVCQELDLGKIGLLFLRRLLDGPFKVSLCHKIRKANGHIHLKFSLRA